MSELLCDVLAYAVMLGFEFAALCAITRVGRGWLLQGLGFLALVGANLLMEGLWRFSSIPFASWLALSFCVVAPVFFGLVLCLSRDSLGRRIFLALEYIAYAAFYLPVFHLFAYRNVLNLSRWNASLVGLAVVAVANLAFLFWILRWAPRDGRGFRWWGACLAVGLMFSMLFVNGFWPVSLVLAPARYCSSFVLASLAAWAAFPMLFHYLNEQQRRNEVEHSLEMMTAEVKMRRAAIDLAQQLRHDLRHHRVQIERYVQAGQYDKVLTYLKGLDDLAQEAPTDHLVWCENETVNAILSGCARKAEAQGVELVADVEVARTIALSDVELVAVLANLLENALNAAMKCTGGTVTCTIQQRGELLGLKISNTVPMDFRLSPQSLPCAALGIGLESVRKVLNAHKGEWKYSVVADQLTCQAVLFAPPGEDPSKRRDTPCA